MYHFRNLFDKHPIQISGVVVLVVNFIVVASGYEPDVHTFALGESALVGILGLFVSTKTENTAALREVAYIEAEAEGDPLPDAA